jgi:hypothetical protein
MKTIKEKMFYEELKTLLNNGEISFYEDENLNLIISGEEFKDDMGVYNLIREILNMSIKRFALMQNILDRYDNEEYWEGDIVNNSDYDEV